MAMAFRVFSNGKIAVHVCSHALLVNKENIHRIIVLMRMNMHSQLVRLPSKPVVAVQQVNVMKIKHLGD